MTKHISIICIVVGLDVIGCVMALKMAARPGDWWMLGALSVLVLLGIGSMLLIHPNVKKILAYIDSDN